MAGDCDNCASFRRTLGICDDHVRVGQRPDHVAVARQHCRRVGLEHAQVQVRSGIKIVLTLSSNQTDTTTCDGFISSYNITQPHYDSVLCAIIIDLTKHCKHLNTSSFILMTYLILLGRL